MLRGVRSPRRQFSPGLEVATLAKRKKKGKKRWFRERTRTHRRRGASRCPSVYGTTPRLQRSCLQLVFGQAEVRRAGYRCIYTFPTSRRSRHHSFPSRRVFIPQTHTSSLVTAYSFSLLFLLCFPSPLPPRVLVSSPAVLITSREKSERWWAMLFGNGSPCIFRRRRSDLGVPRAARADPPAARTAHTTRARSAHRRLWKRAAVRWGSEL